MGKTYDVIDDRLTEFIERQPMFFVATAPLSASGSVNLSPKGLDSLRIIDEHTVAYADMVGSGIETIAHLKENGRIVVMFCSFEGAPKIVRLHGRGEVVEPSHPRFNELHQVFPEYHGLRAFILIDCQRVSDSCGFGVPLMEFRGNRFQLVKWAQQKGIDDLLEYQRSTNSHSIDGLPGIQTSGSGRNE